MFHEAYYPIDVAPPTSKVWSVKPSATFPMKVALSLRNATGECVNNVLKFNFENIQSHPPCFNLRVTVETKPPNASSGLVMMG